jgi:hypothetical protein
VSGERCVEGIQRHDVDRKWDLRSRDGDRPAAALLRLKLPKPHVQSWWTLTLSYRCAKNRQVLVIPDSLSAGRVARNAKAFASFLGSLMEEDLCTKSC